MKYILVVLVLLVTTTLSPLSLANTEQTTSGDLAKYVAINIEIKELKESGILLKDSAQELSQSLNAVSGNINELSPEQLRLINLLADKMNNITEQLNTTVKQFPKTIENAQEPSSELLNQLLSQVKQATIDPVVSALETWLLITIVGLCILGVALLVAVLICMKSIGKISASVKEVANGYRIIPVEQYTRGE